jgi:hypothetical protein
MIKECDKIMHFDNSDNQAIREGAIRIFTLPPLEKNFGKNHNDTPYVSVQNHMVATCGF